MGAVYLFHDLYGYLLEMSPDVLAVLDDPEHGRPDFVDVFAQHACLVEEGPGSDDERDRLWPFVAVKGRWNVWRRHGDRVAIWTAWGDAPVRRIELDADDTRIWDAIDGETRLAQLRERFDAARILALVERLAHSDVQALKLSMMPMSTFAKKPGLAPRYLTSTMPYRRWTPADGAPEAPGREVSPAAYYQHDVADAEAQFDHQETTLSHLFRRPHPALGGRTYGAALVDALAARGRVRPRLRVLEIGAGLGYVAEAVLDALAARGVEVDYTIVELAPALAAAQRARLAGRAVTWREGDVLSLELDGGYDWILANEMVGDLPALHTTVDELDADTRAWLDRLGVSLDDAPETFYLLTGALQLVERIARWLALGGTAVITEFGELSAWPRLSTQLDHPELSIHFGHLIAAARASGLEADFAFVIDLLGLDRDQKGLATTRSHFRALRAMLADAGVTLEKIGYTPAMLADALAGRVSPEEIGELRWDRIEDRLMGLVPHEFKALILGR